MKKFTSITLVLALIACLACNSKKDDRSEHGKNTSTFVEKLPNFSLKDPNGKTYTSKEISKDGLVLVVTAPTLKNKNEQEGWGKYLDKGKSEKSTLAFLQDMSASSFKHKAREEMKKETKSGQEPILLLDEKGEVREKLKVKKDETVVLVYNDNGKLIYSTSEKPSEKSAQDIWKAVKK